MISSEEEINISSHNLKTFEENEMLYKKIEELNNILEEKTIDYEELEEKLKNKEKENEENQF